MAVSGTKLTTTLVLKVKSGVDEAGKDIIKSVNFRKVKTSALEQDIFDVAQGIAVVLKYPVNGVLRQDVNELISL